MLCWTWRPNTVRRSNQARFWTRPRLGPVSITTIFFEKTVHKTAAPPFIFGANKFQISFFLFRSSSPGRQHANPNFWRTCASSIKHREMLEKTKPPIPSIDRIAPSPYPAIDDPWRSHRFTQQSISAITHRILLHVDEIAPSRHHQWLAHLTIFNGDWMTLTTLTRTRQHRPSELQWTPVWFGVQMGFVWADRVYFVLLIVSIKLKIHLLHYHFHLNL